MTATAQIATLRSPLTGGLPDRRDRARRTPTHGDLRRAGQTCPQWACSALRPLSSKEKSRKLVLKLVESLRALCQLAFAELVVEGVRQAVDHIPQEHDIKCFDDCLVRHP